MEKETALLYAQMPEYKYLVRKTERFIQESLSKVSKPYVACSFGKDSSVMLHLILKYAPNIKIRFATHPETELLDDYKNTVDWWLENYNINLTQVFCDGGFVKVKHHQRNMLDDTDSDSFFVGLRADESFGRRVSLKTYGAFYKLKSDNRTKICPLAWWNQNHIAAYIHSNNIPLLDKYKFGGIQERTTSGISRTNLQETMNSLKQRDMNRYNKLLQLFPDAAYYV